MKQITYSKTIENLRGLMRDYILKSNIKSLVLGISGGIDSALVAVLVKPVCDELDIPLIGRSITIGSNSSEEISRANAIGNLFCSDFDEIDLTSQFDVIQQFDDLEQEKEPIIDKSYRIRMGNFKARMRMMYLYNLASKNNGLVLSTDNMTELLLGFWTLHGDVGDYGLIQELWKTEVYDMSEWLSNNELNTNEKEALMSCVNGDATDGLGITSTDLDQILPDWRNRHKSTRSGYAEVDTILNDYLEMVDKLINGLMINERLELSEKILKLNEHPIIVRHINSQFKRENPFNEKRESYIVY
jgi:NAD+ synthetase